MKVQTSLKSGQNVAAMIVPTQSSTSPTPAGNTNPLYAQPVTSGTNPFHAT